MYCRNSMRGKIYHQTIFFPHLIISFLASFFSKFPISTLFLLFVSLLQLQNPFFLCSFISRSFCCSPSLFFSFLPPPPLKFYTSLFCFIPQYEGHDSTFRASCSPPNCTNSLMGFDNTVTSTCRVLRQKAGVWKPCYIDWVPFLEYIYCCTSQTFLFHFLSLHEVKA